MTCCKSTSTGVGMPTTAPTNNDPDIYIEQPSGQIWVWNGTQWIKPPVGAISYDAQTRVLTVGSSSAVLPVASTTGYGVVKLSSDTNNPLVVAPDGSITIDCSKLITHCNLATKADLTPGVDCEAIGALPTRAYITGDSVLVHGQDGSCARVMANRGVFSDVRVDTVTQYTSLFTGGSSNIVTTVQNLADSEINATLFITLPAGTGYSIGTPVIANNGAASVTALGNYTYGIQGIGRGDKVIVTLPITFTDAGSYGISSAISIEAGNIFDYSTSDDTSAVNVNVTAASTGSQTTDCPLVHVHTNDGITELPVVQAKLTYLPFVESTTIVLTDDAAPLTLRVKDATTAIAHSISLPYATDYTSGTYITTMDGKALVGGSTATATTSDNDALGVTFDAVAGELHIPAPADGKYVLLLIELMAGPTCTRQHLRLVVARKSDVTNPVGVVEVTPIVSGASVTYNTVADKPDYTSYVIDTTGLVTRATFSKSVRKATLTLPAHTAYTGTATLAGTAATISSVGNVKLKGTGASHTIGIDINNSATSLDTVVDFSGLLTINITD